VNEHNVKEKLIDTMICANAAGYSMDGEVLVTPIGLLPRIAASLAMKSSNPDMMMTDSQCWMLSDPNPVAPRDTEQQANENWMGLSRVFDNVWSGNRHITCSPVQIDRFGQANVSVIGDDYSKPNVQMLGVRGFPGNSICHASTYFILSHNRRVFVEGECDYVCSIGYNPKRLPRGYTFDDIDLRQIVTDLCVMDFDGENKAIRVRSLHEGVSLEQVRDNTSFDLAVSGDIEVTSAPLERQMELIRRLDSSNQRYGQL
jgi:glutaconate CoA-transferase subunit B|tara:strand:- start:1848 stop:2621 length:774 start_codon:yes stop_codon:yes gene_type:complete